MRTTLTPARPLATAGAALALTLSGMGVASADSTSEGSVPESATHCSDVAYQSVVRLAVEELNEKTGEDWDWRTADVSTLEDCADLSYVVVEKTGSTGSSPRHILLFHEDAYLGTATAAPRSFYPEVTRTGDDSLDVTYSYVEDDEPNAAPQGRASATFTWSGADQRVVMTGEASPE